MATDAEKPQAYKRFEELAKRLISVPKKEIDQKETERKAAKEHGKSADK